jgi:hypothetical protein
MTDSPRPTRRRAADVPAGTAVARGGALFLKAERQGKAFVYHYLVQVAPAAAEAALLYVDPEDELLALGRRLTFDPAGPAIQEEPAPGDLLVHADGTFLMVRDSALSQRLFAFVDAGTGEVRRRRHRGAVAVHRRWHVAAAGTTVEALLAAAAD